MLASRNLPTTPINTFSSLGALNIFVTVVLWVPTVPCESPAKIKPFLTFFATNGFAKKLIGADEDYLKKLIFNRDSYITVGGDEYRGYNIKTIGFEYDYTEDTYYVNDKGEKMPDYNINSISDEDWLKLHREYSIQRGGFWDRLAEYEKDNDVFLKGN